MPIVFEKVMPPKSGLAVVVNKGQRLKLVDLEGCQVIDMAIFNKDDVREKLSKTYSCTRIHPMPKAGSYASNYGIRFSVSEGDALFSTGCRPMMVIVKETAKTKGIHDMHLRCCNRYYYEQAGLPPRDGCLEIISKAVAPYGLRAEDVPDPFNVFMNVPFDPASGRLVIKEPVTQPGDYIELKAEMNCLVGLSNCPDDVGATNAGKCTSVRVEVHEP